MIFLRFISPTPNTTDKNTQKSHYIIIFQYLLLIFYDCLQTTLYTEVTQDLKMLLRGKYGIIPDQRRDPNTIGGVSIPGADDRLQQQQLDGGIPKPA